MKIKSVYFVIAIFLLGLSSCSFEKGPLTGEWSLQITNYKESCGTPPTADPSFMLHQHGRKIKATIDIAGHDNSKHTAEFHGTLSSLKFPAIAMLRGKIDLGDFITEEVMQITIVDEKNFTGSARWTTSSKDKKIICVGSDDVHGTKK